MPTEKTQITPSEMFTHVILNLLVSVALEMTLLARLSVQDVQDLQARISAMKPYCNHELFYEAITISNPWEFSLVMNMRCHCHSNTKESAIS